jgi:Restriction endonuclease
LQTRHYKERQPAPSYLITRIIIETLRQTKDNSAISTADIADQARTTTEQVGRILGQLLQKEDLIGAELSSSDRFNLAFVAARHGALQQVARALTWQEFEAFTETCLQSVGFETQKGVVVKDASRRWQIDVIAKKGPVILAIDCKHWESPAYSSKLSRAAEHQRLAVQALIQHMTSKGEVGIGEVLALPIVLTLFEPCLPPSSRAVAVSFEQFAEFLKGVSPYSSDLPFISAQHVAKSSIC